MPAKDSPTDPLAPVFAALEDVERFGEWWRDNVERMDEVDEDMTMGQAAAHYLRAVLRDSAEERSDDPSKSSDLGFGFGEVS